MREPDRLYLMALFVKIIQLGSFKAAAMDIGVTQSKATKDIQRLEQSIGSTLLNRTTRSVGITRAGEIYYDGAISILSDYDKLTENLDFARDRLSGELRVTAPLLWGDQVLTPLILKFRDSYKDVSIIANYSDQFVDLYRDSVHIAFRSTVPEREPYIAKKICADSTVLCASATYMESRQKLHKPAELEAQDYITYGQDIDHRYSKLVFEKDGKVETVRLSGKLSFSSMRSIFAATLQHQGIASIPRYLAQSKLDDGTLVEVLPQYELQTVWFHALYTERKKDSQLVTTFVDFVRREIN